MTHNKKCTTIYAVLLVNFERVKRQLDFYDEQNKSFYM